jgi:glutamate racemase
MRIGLFDSGVGGTSIWKELVKVLPKESTLYLADSRNAPYGERSKEEILQLCIKNTELLIEQGAKLIIVACNTATTNAISYLREHYDIPFIGIEPAIKPAALASKNKCVGILATKGTLNSSLFAQTSKNFDSIKFVECIGTGLVEKVESGDLDSPELRELLKLYLIPMLDQNIDQLVLGCSHYPYLIPAIKDIIGSNIPIIDSGFAVARQTKNILEQNGLLNKGETNIKHDFYTNVGKQNLAKLLSDYSKIEISEFDF